MKILVYAKPKKKKERKERGRENERAHPGYDRAYQYPPNGQHPKSRLHDLLRLQNDIPPRPFLRVPPLLPFLPFLPLGANKPARRLDVHEGDQAQRDRQRRSRVGVRERSEREECLRVEHGRWLRQPGEEHG